jgi:hypothetical protein
MTHETQDWKQIAEERAAALGESEQQRRAWMKTAQLAEEWADQLGRVRQWLQDQLLTKGRELSEAQQQKEQALARLAALQEQLDAAKRALVQKHEELYRIEQSRGFRILRWVGRRLLPADTLRGRLMRRGVGATLRLLRRGA